VERPSLRESSGGPAARRHRGRRDLYHSALQIRSGGVTFAVEMGPVWNVASADRGVVCEGAVGARSLGRFRAFRYEVRCWPDGSIPDLAEAVGEPHRVTDDSAQVAAVLSVLPQVPPLTWGRDELGPRDMWNSNSLVSWALARTGCDMEPITPPPNGRAPGWLAGLHLADRQRTEVVDLLGPGTATAQAGQWVPLRRQPPADGGRREADAPRASLGPRSEAVIA
jgi:hypothetical protein